MKTLDRTQLKVIAICAMVCDHIAWGFVDFMTPLGQIMHIIGRFTIPIMCFFVAEGFRHTSSVRGYIRRMTFFWLVAVIPFYLFFGEMYEYRQNIIFDLLLGLLMLAVLENKKLKRWQKCILAVGIFGVSITVGGWIIMPILYILVFYYIRDFKRQVKWFCGLTITLELFLIVAMELNYKWHFSHYEWPWYDKMYLLGFMLPLLVLKYYNGQKGKDIIGKYFFYLFYPAHFLVLAGVKAWMRGVTAYEIYVGVHVLALFVSLMILVVVLGARPSRGQTATLLFVLSACIYTFGFLVEITSGNVGGFYAATLTQYFGECLVLIAFTMFVNEMCHKDAPAFLYAAEVVCGLFVMWMLFTTRENHYFYTSIGISYEGPFPRLVLEHGVGFQLFLVYLIVVCTGCFATCVVGIVRSKGIERKRIICTAVSIICPWLPNFIRDAGVTRGYEIPCFGIVLAVVLVGTALIRYGYFDSIALAGENALNHGQEGIMVINNHHIITYYNKRMEEMFGKIALKKDAYENPLLKDIFEGRIKTLEQEQNIYEMRIEPLKEGGYVQGYMLWILDITEHHRLLTQISDLAHKDSLTDIYNRSYFTTVLVDYLKRGGTGSLFMMDLHHFKQVNDRFGHQTGDEVLMKFGQVLQKFETDSFSCRIGGDEFCLFYKEVIDTKEIEARMEQIREAFDGAMQNEKYAGITEIAFGAARILETSDRDFEKLYSDADKALYVAKHRNKKKWYVL